MKFFTASTPPTNFEHFHDFYYIDMYIKLPLVLLDYIGIQEFPKPASN